VSPRTFAGHAWAARVEALGVARGYLLKLGRIAAETDAGTGAASGAAPAAAAGTGASPPQLTGQQLPWTAKLVPGGSSGFKGFYRNKKIRHRVWMLASCLSLGRGAILSYIAP